MQKTYFSTICLQWLWNSELQAGHKVLLPYRAQIAEKDYRELLSESRRGINKTALKLDDLDRLISPLLKQWQPLNHIYATHEDEIGCSNRKDARTFWGHFNRQWRGI